LEGEPRRATDLIICAGTTKQAQGRCCIGSEVPIPHRGRGAQPTCPGLPWRTCLHKPASSLTKRKRLGCCSFFSLFFPTRHFRSIEKSGPRAQSCRIQSMRGYDDGGTYHERTKPIDSRHHTDASTRIALGAGIGLLLSNKLSGDSAKAPVGTLLIGAATTVPLAIEVIAKKEPAPTGSLSKTPHKRRQASAPNPKRCHPACSPEPLASGQSYERQAQNLKAVHPINTPTQKRVIRPASRATIVV